MRHKDDWPALLTTHQASEWLMLYSGVQRSYHTLCGLRSRGGGPTFIKLGGFQIRYRPEDLDIWAHTLCEPQTNTLGLRLVGGGAVR